MHFKTCELWLKQVVYLSFLLLVGEGGGCPDGWYKLRERCYRLGGMTEATRKTWEAAHADCQVDGGVNGGLASIQLYGIQCKFAPRNSRGGIGSLLDPCFDALEQHTL